MELHRKHPESHAVDGPTAGRAPNDPPEAAPGAPRSDDERVELPTNAHRDEKAPTDAAPSRRLPIWMTAVLAVLAIGIGFGAGYLTFGSPFTSAEAWEAERVSSSVMKAWRTGDEVDIEAIYAPDADYRFGGRARAVNREGISAEISRAILVDNTYRQVGPATAYTAWDGSVYVVTLIEATRNRIPEDEPLVAYYRVKDGVVTRHVVMAPYGG